MTISKNEEVLFSWGVKNTWPYVLTRDNRKDMDRIVEEWIPIEETFLKHGKRYFRLVSGHGTWTDIPEA